MTPAATVTLFAAAVLLSGCLGQTTRPGMITMACVNSVMGTEATLPNIVVLKHSDFAERFGGAYGGHFVAADLNPDATGISPNDMDIVHRASAPAGTVYLSSLRGPTILPHELAHHARVQAGGTIDEAEARRVARVCGPKVRTAQVPRYSLDLDPRTY